MPTDSPSLIPSQNPSKSPSAAGIDVGFPTTMAPTTEMTTTITDQEEDDDKYFKCKYRDRTRDYYTQHMSLTFYSELMSDAFLNTISVLQEESGWKSIETNIYYLEICTIFTDYSVGDSTCKPKEEFDENDNELDYDEFFSFGQFGIKSSSKNLENYKKYIFELLPTESFLMEMSLYMNEALNDEIGNNTNRRRDLLASEFEAISIEVMDASNDAGSNTGNGSNDFEQKWIWVIIIIVIVIVVMIFFVFICKWRRSIVKNDKKTTGNLTKTIAPLSVQTNSVALSEDDRQFSDASNPSPQIRAVEASPYSNKDRKISERTHGSDADVIQTMFTDGGGTGNDSMYGGYGYKTPMGPEDLNTEDAGNDNYRDDLHSNAMSDRYRRSTTNDANDEDLYRTGTELANMRRANLNVVQNDAIAKLPSLPPQPEIDTPGGLPLSTAIGPDGKMGEKSVDPEVIRKWQSNSQDSSSDDNEIGDAMYQKHTPNETPY